MGRRYKSHEFRKQSIQCKKEKQLITGRCGGQIRGEQADNLKVGDGSFPNKRILRNNLCFPACKQKNIATKLRDTA